MMRILQLITISTLTFGQVFCQSSSEPADSIAIKSAGCSVTALHAPLQIEQTLALIKPDGVKNSHVGEIIATLEQAGFKIVAMKMLQLSKQQAESFYSPHQNQSFYPELVNFMTSGPIIAIVLEGKDAIAYYRSIMGATDPAKAAPHTLRSLYAQSLQQNAVHGSDSKENARREIGIIFSSEEINQD